MGVWKLKRLARQSTLTGEVFPPDTEIVTALFGEEEEVGEDKVRGTGFLRRDYLASEAEPALLEGAWCIWRTRTPAPRPDEERRLDLDMARQFLERLLGEGRDDRGPVCMTLALLLIRKRKLNLISEKDGVLTARWPRETETFPVPAPEVTEADAEQLQQELQRLFDM